MRFLAIVSVLLIGATSCFGDTGDDHSTGPYTPATDDADVPDDIDAYEVGTSYRSETGYVEYIPGDIPIVVSVPHGGYKEPEAIDDRSGTTVQDAYTLELGEEFADAFYDHTGHRVHIVNLLMARTKLDGNRDLDEGAEGDPLAETVWHEFHHFIDEAKTLASDADRHALYLDLHGHGNPLQRVELGYLLIGNDLRNDDSDLDNLEYIEASSIRTLYEQQPSEMAFSELLRGPDSLGGQLEERGHASVPSPTIDAPEWYSIYFNGGYNTEVHGSRDGGSVSGIQIEAHRNVRFDEEDRLQFADDLAEAVIEFADLHYEWDW